MRRHQSPKDENDDFSLVLGGPLYQLFIRTRMMRPPLQLLYRRLILIPALAWLPLLVLSIIDGRAAGTVGMPFLADIGVYSRFLIAMPILILAEPIVHYQMRDVIAQFHERRLVPPAAAPDFSRAVTSAKHLRNSKWAEIAILVLAFVAGPRGVQEAFSTLQTSAWHSTVEDGRVQLTLAGWWFVHISIPMFQFLLLRWYFRVLVWWRLLWQLSRLPLSLTPTHPDRAGGIGFLGEGAAGFAPVLFAQAAVVSGFIADRVHAGNRSVTDFVAEIVVLVVLMVLFAIGPLLFFSRQMFAARRDGLRRYGALASEYAGAFEDKWQHGRRPAGEALLGTADIQSMTDLIGSNDVVRDMKPTPLTMRVFIALVAATALPFLPLALIELPFREVVSRVLSMML